MKTILTPRQVASLYWKARPAKQDVTAELFVSDGIFTGM